MRCVGTLRCSCSSSLSCRLQCLASSFFTPPPTPLWKGRGCVCLCEKHTWQRRRPITPPLHQPTSTSTPSPLRTSSFSALHPTFFPSLLPRPWGERWIWGWWCQSWQPEVSEFREVNYLTLFTMHADSGICMWKLKQFLYTGQVLYTACGKVFLSFALLSNLCNFNGTDFFVPLVEKVCSPHFFYGVYSFTWTVGMMRGAMWKKKTGKQNLMENRKDMCFQRWGLNNWDSNLPA